MRNGREKMGKLRNGKRETSNYVNEQQTEDGKRSKHRLSRALV